MILKERINSYLLSIKEHTVRGLTSSQGLLWLQKCWPQKNRKVSNSVASSKKSEPENLDAITCSYKIVLRSSMQILSLMTPVLKSWYCHKGKLLCLLWSFLLYWTFCLLWGHFHAENETDLRLRTTSGSLPTSVTNCDLSWLTRK